jgi:azurin
MKRRFHPLPPLLALLILGSVSAQAREIKLGVKTGELKYDTTRLMVKPEEKIELVFSNADQMPHNVVICKMKTDIKKVNDAAIAMGADGLTQNYLPKMPEILWATPLVQQGKSFTLKFSAPKQQGEYPFVCSFPGHYMMMNGILQVGGKPPKATPLSELSYKYYEGSWDKLPDFSKLEPKSMGLLPKNLVDANVKGFNADNYGVVFNAKLTVPADGKYTISAGSDDGGRILIDSKKVWEHDGLHGVDIKNVKVDLKKGVRDIEIQFFEKSGGNDIQIAWKPVKEKKYQNWSVNAPSGGGTSGEPIIIAPTEKPVFYRDFFSTAGARGVGIGYPELANALFDANYCRWMQLWRGDFLNAKVHWVGRGGGQAKPEGDDVVTLFSADPVAVLKDAAEKWPARAEHKGDIPGEKSGVHFGGYLLDKQGRPTMLYSIGGIEVTDRLDPLEVNGAMCFKRTLALKGKLDGLHVFGGRARKIEGSGSGPYNIGDELSVTFKLKGFGEPSIRPNDKGFDLVLPVKAGQTSATLEEIIEW